MKSEKTILVAPLNWGLGHATRSIPIIRALLNNAFKVLLASDGEALALLRKEFPDLPHKELPGYNISYARKKRFFKAQMLLQSPKMLKAAKKERQLVAEWVEEGLVDGIISDNRLGIRNENVYSVFMTHQLEVLSGNTTGISSKMHKQIIKKFDRCWVPDYKQRPNLSGRLGHPSKLPDNVDFIGPLSRFSRKELPKRYDYLVLLSGPEPQRTILEEKLLEAFKDTQESVLFVLGKTKEEQERSSYGNIEVVNFMTSNELEEAICSSEVVISRSGYTTIMDLAALQKKALFIPTPGQYEQEYLAKKMSAQGLVPYVTQDRFTLDALHKVPLYSGLRLNQQEFELKSLFAHF